MSAGEPYLIEEPVIDYLEVRTVVVGESLVNVTEVVRMERVLGMVVPLRLYPTIASR